MLTKKEIKDKLSELMGGQAYEFWKPALDEFVYWLGQRGVFADDGLPPHVLEFMRYSDPLQDRIIEFVHQRNLEGVGADYREIGKHIDISSTSRVYHLVVELINAGILVKEDKRPRSIRIRKGL